MIKACVVFDTKYGNTEKIARSLEAGLRGAGLQTVSVSVDRVAVDSLGEYDLICLGGPTHNLSASETMKRFLESLSAVTLAGKRAFVFDTRRDSALAGSAAKYIEIVLRKRGMEIVGRRESAIIVGPELTKWRREFESKEEWKEWRHKSEGLREGEEVRFERIGSHIGKLLQGTP
jgi:flavodoxin